MRMSLFLILYSCQDERGEQITLPFRNENAECLSSRVCSLLFIRARTSFFPSFFVSPEHRLQADQCMQPFTHQSVRISAADRAHFFSHQRKSFHENRLELRAQPLFSQTQAPAVAAAPDKKLPRRRYTRSVCRATAYLFLYEGHQDEVEMRRESVKHTEVFRSRFRDVLALYIHLNKNWIYRMGESWREQEIVAFLLTLRFALTRYNTKCPLKKTSVREGYRRKRLLVTIPREASSAACRIFPTFHLLGPGRRAAGDVESDSYKVTTDPGFLDN